MYKFSPSTLNLLKDCPKCFWLQFKKDIKRPVSIFPSLPSGIDKTLKEYFDLFLQKNELPPELKSLEYNTVDSLLNEVMKMFNVLIGKLSTKRYAQKSMPYTLQPKP
mgnify:CR=1 FL=1